MSELQIPPIQPPALIADKYKTPEDFDQGFRELHKQHAGFALPSSLKVVGEGGVHATVDEAVTAYKSMQAQFTKSRQAAAPSAAPAATPATPPPLKIETPVNLPVPDEAFDDPEDAIRAAGLNRADLSKSWSENGKFTDEQYTKLKTVGFNKAAANALAQAEEARLAASREMTLREVDRAAAMVGGRDKLDAMLKGAAEFVPADRIPKINQMLARGDVAEAVLAIQGYASTQKRSEFATGAGIGGMSKPATAREENDILRRAMQGDAAAMEMAKRLSSDLPSLSVLKGS
jgi:hypothetical protein